MKYFKLEYNSDFKESGIFPQCEKVIAIGDVQKEIMHLPGYIDFDFELPKIKLEKKARQNSLISAVAIPPWFLVVDDELLKFLKEFKIGNHQDWKIKAEQDKLVIEKYNLFIANDSKESEYIDFSNSEFCVGTYKDSSFRGEKVTVKDYEDYLLRKTQLRNDRLWLRESKLVLNLTDASEDMFRIMNAPFGGYYISEKLKTAIEKQSFTGLIFKEFYQVSPKIEVVY